MTEKVAEFIAYECVKEGKVSLEHLLNLLRKEKLTKEKLPFPERYRKVMELIPVCPYFLYLHSFLISYEKREDLEAIKFEIDKMERAFPYIDTEEFSKTALLIFGILFKEQIEDEVGEVAERAKECSKIYAVKGKGKFAVMCYSKKRKRATTIYTTTKEENFRKVFNLLKILKEVERCF